MKAMEEYLKDPRILDDPDMAGALEPIKEIHAIRLKIQDERAGMTSAEYNRKAEASLAKRGLSFCYDLIGQGKLQTHTPFDVETIPIP